MVRVDQVAAPADLRNQRMRRARARRGYSLVELVVVLGIVSVLALLSLPLLDLIDQREKERELRRALWEIRDAIDAWHAAYEQGVLQAGREGGSGAWPGSWGPFPPDLSALLERHDSVLAGTPQAGIRFLRRIPRDPFADPLLPAARTWGLRSFRSSADAPEPGDDVYDVFSLSTKRGLDGIPLRDW
jgi:general secretion pathway protein G